MDEVELLQWLVYLNMFHVWVSAVCRFLDAAQRKNYRRWWVRPVNLERRDQGSFWNLFLHYKHEDHDEFFRYTRMTVPQFNQLLKLVKPHLLKRSRRQSLNPEERLAMTLKYLAQGGSRQSVALEFRVGKSTFSKVVIEVCKVLWNILNPIYMKEPTQNEWNDIINNFWMTWNFPNCLGAIDSKQIRCKCFPKTGSQYYEKYSSVVLMACCDANYVFTWVDVGDYGSKNDGSVFSQSAFGKLVLQNHEFSTPHTFPGTNITEPCVFVADAAFPLKDCIMRPFPGKNLSPEQAIFNCRLSRARRTIENTFGILAACWEIYGETMSGSPDTVISMILATTALHNYIMKTNADQYLPYRFAYDETDTTELLQEENWRRNVVTHFEDVGRIGSNTASRAAISLRNQFADFFISESGEVHWQWSHTNQGYDA